MAPVVAGSAAPPARKPAVPALHLQVLDLSHPGSELFFSHTSSPQAVLRESAERVLHSLYPPSLERVRASAVDDVASHPPFHPPIRSITLHLRAMDGVAHTCSSDLDQDHKEVHLSTTYLATVYSNSGSDPRRIKQEIEGVLTHELVHAFQWDGEGTMPGGVIEGIADWVRAEHGLGPPHWQERPGEHDKWDAGYQTTGFFFAWLSRHFENPLLVPQLNLAMRSSRWSDGEHFTRLLGGQDIEALWETYKKSFRRKDDGDDEPPEPVPTHRAGSGYNVRY
ncbi:hypothetical protein JCM1841_004529 [Sporobolomyces salmonicolor]